MSYEQQKLIAEAAQAQLRAANFSGSTAKDGPARLRERNAVLTGRPEEPETDADTPEDTPTDPLLAELTPWARHLFQNLQAAGLLDRPQIQDILSRWQQSGGKLTAVIGECTGLKATTVAVAVRFPVGCRRHSTFKFFADGGYSARLSGCRTVGEHDSSQ
ncbi:hypothetical protein [Synechococcus sp. R5-12]|uniref:hypothetical protein n=1 Tax=Synechococcus sp. R5-12 TaxID=2421321 RepID=UPI0039C6272B